MRHQPGITGPDPTQAEVDAVARQLLATVETPPRIIRIGGHPMLFVKDESDYGTTRPNVVPPFPVERESGRKVRKDWVAGLFEEVARKRAERMRTYPTGCTCPKMKIGDPPQTYDRACPIAGHRRLAT